MEQQTSRQYAFDDFRVDAAKRLAYDKDGEVLPLKPKAFEILLYLIENSGRIIERDELLSAIWADTVVEENNLTQHISTLRRLFGEKPGEHRYIVTVPGHGYKFVADVRSINGNTAPSAKSLPPDEASGTSLKLGSQERKPNGTRPRLLISLLVLVFVGLGTAGFLIWRDNSTVPDAGKFSTLAVLPFKPLVAEHRDESIELGMADTMIAKLSDGEIRVRPLAAVRRFNAVDQDPVAAGRELGVETVLDGSIQMANDRVRVSAKLIRVSDGKQLWADQYNEASKDIFALQDSISGQVATALQATLGNKNTKNYTDSVEAYQLFAKGKFHSARLVLPEVRKGIAYYEEAIAVDPKYALAYVELANAYRAMLLTNDARPSDVMPKAKAAAKKAAEIDDRLSEAQTALAFAAFWYDFDPIGAEKYHRRAIDLDPRSSQSRFAYAHLLSNIGRHDEALVEIRRARELEPVNLITNALEGQILFFAGRGDEAMRVLRATADMEPNFWLAPLFISRIHLKNGALDDAIVAASKARDLSGGNSEAISTIGFAYAKAGRIAEARAILRELEGRARNRYVAPYAVASLQVGLGEKEKALDLLDKAFENHDPLMVFLKVDSKWDSLRAEPRFVELLRKMNLQ